MIENKNEYVSWADWADFTFSKFATLKKMFEMPNMI